MEKIAALGLCCLLTGASQMLMPVDTQAAGQWSGYIQDYSTKEKIGTWEYDGTTITDNYTSDYPAGGGKFLRQHRTELVVQMRSQIV